MNEVDYQRFQEEYVSVMGEDNVTDLGALFTLSSSLRQTLVPVRASSFKTSLRQRLEKQRMLKSRLPNLVDLRSNTWTVVAAAGSLLSLAGVLVLIIRRIRNAGKVGHTPAAASI